MDMQSNGFLNLGMKINILIFFILLSSSVFTQNKNSNDLQKAEKSVNENLTTNNEPKIIAHFGGKSSGTIKKIDAYNIPILKAKSTDDLSKVKYQVIGFQLLVYKDGKPIKMFARGERLTNAQKELVKKTDKGSNIVFSKIKVRDSNGLLITLENNLVLTLN